MKEPSPLPHLSLAFLRQPHVGGREELGMRINGVQYCASKAIKAEGYDAK